MLDGLKGYVLDSFQLRGAARKLGFERGAPEDGGWLRLFRNARKWLG